MSSNICPRCNKRVYSAEEAIGAGSHWHQSCFSCKVCKKSLDSTTLADKDGEIYCRACHGKAFGPKGYGFGGGAAGLTMGEAPQPQTQTQTQTQTQPQPQPQSQPVQVQTESSGKCSCGVENQKGKFCGECGRPISPSAPPSPTSGSANSPSAPTEKRNSLGSSVANTAAAFQAAAMAQSSSTVKPSGSQRPSVKLGGGEICPRCNKTVFLAERALGAGKSWHKSCFTCKECKKGLDSDTLQDKGNEIYCRACYGKLFGPKGYGYGGGSGALKNT